MSLAQQLNEFFDAQVGIDPYVVERARALCLGYLYHYGTPYTTLGIEVPFRLPLLSPEDGKPIPGAKPYTGKVDWVLRTNTNLLYFCDRKTTSKCDSAYWEKLKMDAQLSLYQLAAIQSNVEIDGFLWDVIIKPKLETTALTKKDMEEIDTGYYRGMPLRKPEETAEWKGKETPQLHGLKVLAKCIENPESVYQQRVLYRSSQDTLSFWIDTVRISGDMAAVKSEEDALRNRGSCGAFGRTCPYISICCHEDPERMGFKKKQFKKDKDSEVFAGGTSISAINEFQLCQRRWWYNRKECIEPVYTQADDATDLGTLVHSGLEVVARSTFNPDNEFKLPIEM